MMQNGASKKKIMAASIIGCVVTLQLGAFSVTLETLASGITELPFTAFVSGNGANTICASDWLKLKNYRGSSLLRLRG
ncbi:MAG: hypothetical protein ACLRR3_04325 [Eubacterium sp.]